MEDKIAQLTFEAKRLMKTSADPVHDITHAARVAAYAEQLAEASGLSKKQKHAIVLAAWWHDVARTITKRPSFMLMPFFDDLLSAIMLWTATIRHGLFGSVAGMSTRLIFCKSLGTGAILTRLLIRKRNRIMIDILKDADNLDVLNHERIIKMMPFIDSSAIYRLGYKTMIRWFLSTKQLEMKTQAARAYVIHMLKTLLRWMRQAAIYAWHVYHFGEAWCRETIRRAEVLLKKIERRYILSSFNG